jgi:hypothetical protein
MGVAGGGIYRDGGPIQPLPLLENRQHFIVSAPNFYFMRQLELNIGVESN